MDRVVVIGAGHAGVQVADSLRAGGYTGAVTVVGEEAGLPYQRPPLSKDYLGPGGPGEPLPLRGDRFFADCGIDLRTGLAATGLDLAARSVALSDGSVLDYEALVLATGAANRTLPGADLDGVHHLRTLTEAQVLRGALDRAESVVVVGAGFIGLELAAVARKRGRGVTVLETANRVLGRAVSLAMSEYLASAHRRMGVDLRLEEGVDSFESVDGRVLAVASTRGEVYPADLVLVGIGALPRTELAAAAGLQVDNGIVVDAHLRTSDPHVYAVGDCATFPSVHASTRVRLESVQNATDQARHVAAAILGSRAPYAALPWFWSQQGPIRLQIAGLTRPGDETAVCGEVGTGKFSVLAFDQGQLTAVESVNKPADHMAARKALAGDCPLTPNDVTGPAFNLKVYAENLALPLHEPLRVLSPHAAQASQPRVRW
ncbi:NAD(P)/FAD-dependent oxidoreductase [Georgenia sp. EYE_87]|uniref:NAD(P)/FAD-dependent oxidoreductase n=1 Tax=Georgenia sp. EYE_87 TaxID=2853448 RepID=UPI0020035921|nr:FAD-dependent oxidoreductase [Georgenia sp. EYE_87]